MKKIILLFISLLLISGCSKKPAPSATPTPETTKTPVIEPTPTDTVVTVEDIQKKMEDYGFVISMEKDVDEIHDAVAVKMNGVISMKILILKDSSKAAEIVTIEQGQKGTNTMSVHLDDEKRYIISRNVEEDGKIVSQTCVGYNIDDDKTGEPKEGAEKCMGIEVDYSNSSNKARLVQLSNIKVSDEDLIEWAEWYYSQNK